MPKFSIVIPIKKGKAYLKKCIESILEQTYTDYEIIILADTISNDDGTIDWLNTLMLPNLKIYQSDQEIGIQQNWARIIEIPKGEFFTILGYDDILYENYLQEIKGLIENHPDATLYQTQFDFIDSNGNITGNSDFVSSEFDGPSFLESILLAKSYVMATGFVMRSIDYERVNGIPSHYPNVLFADYELWLRLTLLNKQVVSKERCFAFRIHQSVTKVSSEILMLKAFSYLNNYIESLATDPALASIIKENAGYFLKFNCNYIMYRLIRKEVKYREGLKVADILLAFNEFARQLNIEDINFLQVKSIWLAWLIDSNILFRNAYLIFKKLVKKPVVKPSFE
jgi:glycosyltransferase involved in cell wall biosynthesis